ncbi:MAG: transferrin-binding protein-like solute binding protein [Rhodobacteraceae bacterium]|nr:transferrin-binding protein-like solute binding protein [Paracoccaceae bacterium]
MESTMNPNTSTSSRAAVAIALVAGFALAAPFAEASPRLSDAERIEFREAWRAIRPTWREFRKLSVSQSPGASGESSAAGASGASKASYGGFTLLSPSLSSAELREARRQFRQTRREKRKEFRKQWIEAREKEQLIEQELARAATAINTLLNDGYDATLDQDTTRGYIFVFDGLHPSYNVTISGGFYTFGDRGCGFGASAEILTCNVVAVRSNAVAINRGGGARQHPITLDADLTGGTPGALRAVGGLQLTDVEAAGDSGTRRLGAWMEHSGFYLYTDVSASDDFYDVVGFTVANSFGNASANRPSGNATYRGAMVGTPNYWQSNYGEILVGDAALGYTAATGVVTLDFTNITNIDGGTVPGDITSISFADLNPRAWVTADGVGEITSDLMYSFSPSSDSNTYQYPGMVTQELRARFYGPNHEEVAGRFEHSNIFGVFGAKRQVP